jgi:hypothetical protein
MTDADGRPGYQVSSELCACDSGLRADDQDEQSMRAKLLQAITSGAGFDLS